MSPYCTQIATRACELFVQLRFLRYGCTPFKPKLWNTRIYPGLFECVKFDNMSNSDLRLVVQFCRHFCTETQANHDIDLIHLRQFGEKALDKLVEIDNRIPNLTSYPYMRVPHGRNNEIFTFSYTFSYAQTLLSQYTCGNGVESPEFVDKTSKVKWKVKVYFRGCSQKVYDKYVSIYLFRNSEGASQVEREDSEFAKEIFARIEKDDSTSDSTVISHGSMFDNTQNYGRGREHKEFMPISILEGKHTIDISVAIYTKPK